MGRRQIAVILVVLVTAALAGGRAVAYGLCTPLDRAGSMTADTTNGVTQTRDHENSIGESQANEIVKINGSSANVDHDEAGNMIEVPILSGGLVAGHRACTYDAWNRLVTVKSDSGTTLATMKYDGLNRRTVKVGLHTSHYYHSGDSVVETRVGNDEDSTVHTQYVWGSTYIDELVQIGVNDKWDDDDEGEGVAFVKCDSFYWACQDANYNVTQLYDSDGALVERYIYTPHGRREVFIPADSDTFGTHAIGQKSQRVIEVNSEEEKTFSICDIGHQGLMYDKEIDLHYNRARYLESTLGRFTGRDPKEYIDGNNLYEYLRGNPLNGLDPMGTRLERDPVAGWLSDMVGGAMDAVGDASEWVAEGVVEHAPTFGRAVIRSGVRSVGKGPDGMTLEFAGALIEEYMQREMREACKAGGMPVPEENSPIKRVENAAVNQADHMIQGLASSVVGAGQIVHDVAVRDYDPGRYKSEEWRSYHPDYKKPESDEQRYWHPNYKRGISAPSFVTNVQERYHFAHAMILYSTGSKDEADELACILIVSDFVGVTALYEGNPWGDRRNILTTEKYSQEEGDRICLRGAMQTASTAYVIKGVGQFTITRTANAPRGGAGTLDTIPEGQRLMLRPVEIKFPARGMTPAQQRLFAAHLAEQEAALNRLSVLAPDELTMNLANYQNINPQVAASRALGRQYLPGSGAGQHAAHRLDTVAGGRLHDLVGFRDPIQSRIGSLWRTRVKLIRPRKVHRLVPKPE